MLCDLLCELLRRLLPTFVEIALLDQIKLDGGCQSSFVGKREHLGPLTLHPSKEDLDAAGPNPLTSLVRMILTASATSNEFSLSLASERALSRIGLSESFASSPLPPHRWVISFGETSQLHSGLLLVLRLASHSAALLPSFPLPVDPLPCESSTAC